MSSGWYANIIVALLVVLPAVAVFGLSAPEPPTDAKAATARMVHYSGKVQGVGFRNTAARIATGFPVTGWVKNLDDGRVQLLVEGPADKVQDFLKAIRTYWKDSITKEQIEEQPVTGKFKQFVVER